jgi:hypothetical protein
MAREVRQRFWIELALAAISAILMCVTVVWHDWIEIVFRVDPDHGNGWFEWVIVVVAFVLAATLSIGARWEWRRTVRHALHGVNAP